MILFIPIREILSTDDPTLVKLKKYNKCASMLNYYCEGCYLSPQKKALLLEELFTSGKEINSYELNQTRQHSTIGY
jgi:hypothetical protein